MKAWCDPLRLHDNGWHLVPLCPGSKRPAITGWNRFALAQPTLEQVARWDASFPACGWGLVCGSCAVAVDNDCDAPEASGLFEAVRLRVLGETPAVRVGKPGRLVALYRPTEPIRYVGLPVSGGEVHGLNADLTTGRQVAIYGPHPRAPAGRYVWTIEDLQSLRPRDLPGASADRLARFADAVELAFVAAGLARPVALTLGRPGVIDRAAALAVRRAAARGGGSMAALAEAERLLVEAAGALRCGVKVARHPLALALVLSCVAAGCTPRDVADGLWGAWEALLDTRERRARRGELLAMALWASRKGIAQ